MSTTSTALCRQKGSASICCTPTILHCLITKQLLRPTWLAGIQAEVETHQMRKLDQSESIKIDLNQIICHSNLPEFQSSQKLCKYCYKEDFERKTFVKCTESRVFLCLVKERNFHETSFLLKMTLIYHIFAYLLYCDFIYTAENKISCETLNSFVFYMLCPSNFIAG